MDVVAANFPDELAAEKAAVALTHSLNLDADLVSVAVLGPRAETHAGQPVLVAWVPEDGRRRARRVIARHAGRHVPLDWVQGLEDDVAAESFAEE